ncbi:MAG: heavy-metal-associated domain-containing protein [Senegalia sp. (in: firmicutes)]|uniref:heavy-metal-associated domain-containing protein n=1 Tax=Senegalia sp. (in: firmicutes) TaxID=1924098 RepID=UPI003F9599D6
MKKATIQLEPLTCPSCIQKIEAAVAGVDGVDKDSIKVSFNSSKAKFDFDEEKNSIDKFEEAIDKVGYEVKSARAK